MTTDRTSSARTPDYSRVTSRCFINVPFDRLVRDFDLVLSHGIQPEIGLEGDFLYTATGKDFERAAEKLRRAGLACTLHAPFFDLAPGALDRHIREATRNKLRLAFSLIPVFRPRSIVCHLNYEAERHGYKKEDWFGHALKTFEELLAMAEPHRVPVMLENTYENSPAIHLEILRALDSPYARFCFDVGHTLAFARNTWQDWFPAMESWLGQLHIHDNRGDIDAHLPPGRGCFDFAGFFRYLKDRKLNPLITLEPHTEEDLWQSLEAVDRLGLLDLI